MCLVCYNLQVPSNPFDKQRMLDGCLVCYNLQVPSNPFDKQDVRRLSCLLQLTGTQQPLWQTEDVRRLSCLLQLTGTQQPLWQTEDVRRLVMCLVCYNLQGPSNPFDKQRSSNSQEYVSCLLQLAGPQQPRWQTEDVRQLVMCLVCYSLQQPHWHTEDVRQWYVLSLTTYTALASPLTNRGRLTDSDIDDCVCYRAPATPLTNRGRLTVTLMCLLQGPSKPFDKQRTSDSDIDDCVCYRAPATPLTNRGRLTDSDIDDCVCYRAPATPLTNRERLTVTLMCLLQGPSNPFDKQRTSDSDTDVFVTGPQQPLWQTEDVWQTVTLMTVFVTGPQQPLWQTENVWQWHWCVCYRAPATPLTNRERLTVTLMCLLQGPSNPFDKQRTSDSDIDVFVTGPQQPLWQTENVWQWHWCVCYRAPATPLTNRERLTRRYFSKMSRCRANWSRWESCSTGFRRWAATGVLVVKDGRRESLRKLVGWDEMVAGGIIPGPIFERWSTCLSVHSVWDRQHMLLPHCRFCRKQTLNRIYNIELKKIKVKNGWKAV